MFELYGSHGVKIRVEFGEFRVKNGVRKLSVVNLRGYMMLRELIGQNRIRIESCLLINK